MRLQQAFARAEDFNELSWVGRCQEFFDKLLFAAKSGYGAHDTEIFVVQSRGDAGHKNEPDIFFGVLGGESLVRTADGHDQ